MNRNSIEVFADIWCPFAYVGLTTTFARRRALGRDDVPIIVRAWPLELVNGVPLDPEVTNRHVIELREQVAPDLFAGFTPDNFPTSTLAALAIVAGAYRHSTPVGEAVSMAIRDALFEQGLNLEDPAVLAHIALCHGLGAVPRLDDELRVISDWHEGQARGVRGSPHFFWGEMSAFCPALEIDKDAAGHLVVKLDPERLESFLVDSLMS